LKLTPNDILDRKLILKDTKSGKEQEKEKRDRYFMLDTNIFLCKVG
jgi:hypothetical protein